MSTGQIRRSWHESAPLRDTPVGQVYGYVLDSSGRMLILWDGHEYTLPGGKMEAGESFEETLRRETIEEAQATLGDIAYLGYQLVENDVSNWSGCPYLQLRFIARLHQLLPEQVDPATGRRYQRMLVPGSEASEFLAWGHTGRLQLESVKRRALSEWGLHLDALT